MAEALKAKYRLGGMDCAACATKIENAVSRIPGVSEVGASYTAGTMNVTHEDVPFIAIKKAVTALGYSVTPADAAAPPMESRGRDHQDGEQHIDLGEGPWWRTKKARLTLAGGLALGVAYILGLIVPAFGHLAFVVALLVGLVPIATAGYRGSHAPERRSRSRR